MDLVASIFIFIILFGFENVNAVVLNKIEVPEIADFRDNITLACSYSMGKHKLNSVKWYKDGMEFFRYSPMMNPVFMTFNVNGVILSKDKFYCNGFTCSIELCQLSMKSSGAYCCEVSGDAPEFKLTSQTANMTIAALPKHDPIVNGIVSTYRRDDFIVGNCTSAWSSPPASLSWYINEEKASLELLQPQQETTTHMGDFILKRSNLEISFYLDVQRIKSSKGALKMKCVSEIHLVHPIARFVREQTVEALILSDDDLRNQKWMDLRSIGKLEKFSGSKKRGLQLHVEAVNYSAIRLTTISTTTTKLLMIPGVIFLIRIQFYFFKSHSFLEHFVR